jgi:hypothetical protein
VSLTPEEQDDVRRVAGMFRDSMLSTDIERRLSDYSLRLLAEVEELERKLVEKRGVERRCAALRSALSAYRSALRSGERESDQLRRLGDAVLADPPRNDGRTGSEA